jgi:uncharacterized membrane protein YdfJ with MMPL/SSD domain
VLGILALARPKSFLDIQNLNGGDMLDKLFGQGQKIPLIVLILSTENVK